MTCYCTDFFLGGGNVIISQCYYMGISLSENVESACRNSFMPFSKLCLTELILMKHPCIVTVFQELL